MKIDLLHTFSWEETNELVQHSLGLNAPMVRCFAGLSHAVFEVGFGSALLFSHKKNMGLISGDTWAFEGLLPHLYKDGFQVQEKRKHKLVVKEYIEQLKKETSFVLWNEDHPVLGTIADQDPQWADELDQQLNDRRIFSFRVSHSAFRYRPIELRPYTVRLCSITPQLTIALCGARFRSPPMIAQRMVWDPPQTASAIKNAFQNNQESRKVIDQFEHDCQKKTGFRPLLTSDHRLFDRAVIYHPEINSDAVLHLIKGQLGSPLQSPMHENDLEILNLCRWKPVPPLRNWWEPLPSDEILRGLLVLGLPVLGKSQLMTWLQEGESASSIQV